MDDGQTRQEGVDSETEDEDDVRSKLLQGGEGHLTADPPQVEAKVQMPREVQSENVSEASAQGDTPQHQGERSGNRDKNNQRTKVLGALQDLKSGTQDSVAVLLDMAIKTEGSLNFIMNIVHDPHYEDKHNQRSELLGALQHLKAGTQNTIAVLWDMARQTEGLQNFIMNIVHDPRYEESKTDDGVADTPVNSFLQGEESNQMENERPPSNEYQTRGLVHEMDTNTRPPVPCAQMDPKTPVTDDKRAELDGPSKEFTIVRVFKAVSQGEPSQLNGLLDYLRDNNMKLTSPELTDENGKTALLKALLNLKGGKNDTIEVLLKIAEETGDLKNFIDACYQDFLYKGQTALHVAIERRKLDYVKLLVEKGANVQAKACGKFFQMKTELGFYFGELPLSLAACTNQPDIVTFLMENGAKAEDTDFRGNTVLHTLVVIAENSQESTEMISKMYDHVLSEYIKLKEKKTDYLKLENTKNKNGLTPLTLAAKLGKIELLKHILHREFTDEKRRKLSRKITDDWVYGPVHSSLYDINSIETDENNSVLEIVVFGSDVPNRPEMLQIEPLRSLLQDKWDQFASKIFWMKSLVYLFYVSIFTVVTVYRKKGQPPFFIENNAKDVFRVIGQLIIVLGAFWFLLSTIKHFIRNPPKINNLYMDGYSDILFILQAALLLISVVLYLCGLTEYVGLLVLSLAFAWYNILHIFRGSRRMGMYSVMMQRMIMVDLFHFLCVYSVMLLGFSAAILALQEQTPHEGELSNDTVVEEKSDLEPVKCKEPCYNTLRNTMLQLCMFTIGMGDLEFADGVQNQEVFYILLTLYIILTYILLLNMLIALMGSTVDSTSKESENIWKLQRASTILKIERNIPEFLKKTLCSEEPGIVNIDGRKFYRVDEMNWKEWKSALGENRDEDAGDKNTEPQPINKWSKWRSVSIFQRRRQQQQSDSVV